MRITRITRITWMAAGWRKLSWSAVGLVVALGLPCSQAHAHSEDKPPAPAAIPTQAARAARPVLTAERQRNIQQNYLRQPLSFEPNRGQTDKRVQFLSHGAGYSLFLTPADAVLSLQAPAGKAAKGTMAATRTAALEMVTVGGNKLAPATGLEPAASHSNYIIGNDPSKWQSEVPNFARVKYRGIYPGIDLTYYGNQSRLEYDFVVSPGADPSKIKLQFKGMQKLRLDPKGELLIDTAAGPVRFQRPILYQEKADGSRDIVQGSFAISRNEVHFKIGGYDKSRPLVIDPVIAFSTYLGGSGEENFFLGGQGEFNGSGSTLTIGNWISGIAVDSTGSAYIAGTTGSTDFPIGGTGENILGGPKSNARYAFVAKFGPTGALVYSTLLGGSSFNPNTNDGAVAGGIAVDGSGHAYIAGYTSTNNFPLSLNAFQGGHSELGIAGFVTKLSPTGDLNPGGNVYSTYLFGSIAASQGNTGLTYLDAIAVDASGNAYVAGADCDGFPTTPGAYQPLVNANVNLENVNSFGALIGNATNAIFAELNPGGTALVYSTYLGGSVNDVATGIALNPTDNTVYLTGYTDSKDFPTAPAGNVIQGTANSVRQAFVAKLKPSATPNPGQLLYSTYLGGSGGTVNGVTTGDEGHAIAVDQFGNAYVTGSTASTDFPTNGTDAPRQGLLGGDNQSGDIDAFVTKLNSAGTPPLVFSTYLGGSGDDSGQGITLDAAGNFYVTGYTYSIPSNFAGINFPTLPGSLPAYGAANATNSFTPAAFMTEYSVTPDHYIQSTIFQGSAASGSIIGTAIAVDASGNAYLTGETRAGDMPTTSGAYQGTLHGASDAFLTKLWPLAITDGGGNSFPLSLSFDALVNATSPAQTVTLSNTGLAALTISNANFNGAGSSSFFLTGNTCTPALGPSATCQFNLIFQPTAGGAADANLSFVVTDAEGMNRTLTILLHGNGDGLQVSPNPQVFPTTIVGTSSGQSLTVTNPTNVTVTLTTISIPNSGFAVLPNVVGSCTQNPVLAPNGSCNVGVTFAPYAAGAFNSTLTISDNLGGGSTQTVPLSGHGSGLVVTPNNVNYPPTAIGSNTAVGGHITLANNSNVPITIPSISIPANSGFAISGFGNTCTPGISIAPSSGSCSFDVFFTPTSVGPFSSTVTINETFGSVSTSATVPLGGQGVAPAIVINPTPLTFPDTPVGTNGTAVQTLISNTGGAPLTITGFSIPANSGFTLSAADTTCSPSFPLAAQTSVHDGGSCLVGVIFSPTTTTGLTASTLTITDNSGGIQGTTQAVPLSGQGIAPMAVLTPGTLTFTAMAGIIAAPQVLTLTNTTANTLNIDAGSAIITGPGASNFSIFTLASDCGLTLAANSSCTIPISFAPPPGPAAAQSRPPSRSLTTTAAPTQGRRPQPLPASFLPQVRWLLLARAASVTPLHSVPPPQLRV